MQTARSIIERSNCTFIYITKNVQFELLILWLLVLILVILLLFTWCVGGFEAYLRVSIAYAKAFIAYSSRSIAFTL